MTEYSDERTGDAPVGDQHKELRQKLRSKPSVRQQWVLDAQWSDLPVEVEAQVKEAWQDYELGNDGYIFKYRVGENDYPLIDEWCLQQGVPEDEIVWVHWWW